MTIQNALTTPGAKLWTQFSAECLHLSAACRSEGSMFHPQKL